MDVIYLQSIYCTTQWSLCLFSIRMWCFLHAVHISISNKFDLKIAKNTENDINWTIQNHTQNVHSMIDDLLKVLTFINVEFLYNISQGL